MATLAPPDSPSPSRPFRRRTKSFARRCERCCCAVATCFPLAFVYGLTSWAAWVEVNMGFTPSKHAWTGPWTSFLGASLYMLLNASYTVAVFTDPGSPVDTPASKTSRNGYSHLPTIEPRTQIDPSITAVTVSSTGAPRFCKKCLAPKPDRAHHCSTCKRCVLKMDHHCPWLATCVGLHNYKAFLLFLIYISLFCWVCLGVTSQWIWAEVLSDQQYLETLMPINVVMLAVISGIVGLVLTGFTIWHISLACRGITTIECLEKTRYLSPLRKAHQQQLLRQQLSSNDEEQRPRSSTNIPGLISDTFNKAGEELLTIHANAIPGATRLEEGEEHLSPTPGHRPYDDYPYPNNDRQSESSPPRMSRAQASLARLHRSPASREASEERRRYQEYLDEEYTPRLPHAFDHGWRNNLLHLFGPKPWLWWLPVRNTTGDGWRWEVSEQWLRAREEVAEDRRREEERVGIVGEGGRSSGQRSYYNHPYQGHESAPGRNNFYYNNYPYEQDRDRNDTDHSGSYSHSADYRRPSEAGSGLSMHTLDPIRNHKASSTSSNGNKPKRKARTELTTDDDGEIQSFQVSGSDGDGEGDDSSSSFEEDDAAAEHVPRRGRTLREERDAGGVEGEGDEWTRWE